MRCLQATRTMLFASVAAVVLLASPHASRGQQAPVVTQEPGEGARDARLQRKVDVDKIGVDMQALLHDLSDPTLLLSCDTECANQKLQLRIKQRSISQLMSALAEMLPGEWHPLVDKRGYKLTMNPSAVRYRERWWNLFLEARRNALAKQSAKVRDQLHKNIKITSLNGLPPDNDSQFAAAPRFYSSLPDAVINQVAESLDDSAFYSASSNLFFAAGDDEGTTALAFKDLPPQAQELINNHKTAMAADAYVRIVNGGFTIAATVFNLNGRQLSNPVLTDIDITSELQALNLKQDRLLQEANRFGRDAPPEWKALIACQNKRFWNNAPLPPTPDREHAARRTDVLRWLTVTADEEFISDYYSQASTGMEATSLPATLPHPLKEELNIRAAEQDMSWKLREGLYLFRNNRWYRDDLLEVPAALSTVWLASADPATRAFTANGLAVHAAPAPVGPLKEEKGSSLGGVTFRGGSFNGPPLPPAASTRTLSERMEWEAEVVEHLTRWQINNGLRWLTQEPPSNLIPLTNAPGTGPVHPATKYPFYHDAERLMHDYNLARFYADLSAESRAALMRRQLPATALTAAQQAQAFYLAPQLRIALTMLAPNSILLGLRDGAGIFPKTGLIFQAPAAP